METQYTRNVPTQHRPSNTTVQLFVDGFHVLKLYIQLQLHLCMSTFRI